MTNLREEEEGALMAVFGRPEYGGRLELRDHRFAPLVGAPRLPRAEEGPCDVVLVPGVRVDPMAVLRARVASHLILQHRIDRLEELSH